MVEEMGSDIMSIAFWSEEMFYNWLWWCLYSSMNIFKAIKLYTLNDGIVWYVKFYLNKGITLKKEKLWRLNIFKLSFFAVITINSLCVALQTSEWPCEHLSNWNLQTTWLIIVLQAGNQHETQLPSLTPLTSQLKYFSVPTVLILMRC